MRFLYVARRSRVNVGRPLPMERACSGSIRVRRWGIGSDSGTANTIGRDNERRYGRKHSVKSSGTATTKQSFRLADIRLRFRNPRRARGDPGSEDVNRSTECVWGHAGTSRQRPRWTLSWSAWSAGRQWYSRPECYCRRSSRERWSARRRRDRAA